MVLGRAGGATDGHHRVFFGSSLILTDSSAAHARRVHLCANTRALVGTSPPPPPGLLKDVIFRVFVFWMFRVRNLRCAPPLPLPLPQGPDVCRLTIGVCRHLVLRPRRGCRGLWHAVGVAVRHCPDRRGRRRARDPCQGSVLSTYQCPHLAPPSVGGTR